MDISIKAPGTTSLYPELNRIGFNGIDLAFPFWDQREFILSEEFEAQIMDKYYQIVNAGLKVCQTHLTYYPSHLPPLADGSYEAYEEKMLPILIKEIELVSKMNCRIAVIHLYFTSSRENSIAGNLALISKLLPYLEKYNVVLSIENIYAGGYGEAYLSSAEDLTFYTNHFRSDHVGICLDTGHAITRRQDPVMMAEKIGGALNGLHIHSNMPGTDLHLPPCLVNNVDWERFCRTLNDIGYCGAFNMEISPPTKVNEKTALSYYGLAYAIAENLIQGETKSRTNE